MRIKLYSHSFKSIEVLKVSYDLSRNNSGPVICRDCRKMIGAGIGIHRKAFKRSGYLCFSCFSKDVTILTTSIDGSDTGFFIDSLGRLRACYLNSPTVLSVEVIRAVWDALLDEAYTSIEILLGEETAHPWKISDTAESVVGS